jgi:hypothetical protein
MQLAFFKDSLKIKKKKNSARTFQDATDDIFYFFCKKFQRLFGVNATKFIFFITDAEAK